MKKNIRPLALFLFLISVCAPIGNSAENDKGQFTPDPKTRWHSYLGTYVCWDEHFGRSGDEFKDYPNINFRLAKDGHLIGEFRGVEKFLKAGKKAYYCVLVSDLEIKSDGAISFEIGKRKLCSVPIGYKGKEKKIIGTSSESLFFEGKISYDEMTLNCKGVECLKEKMVFGRDQP